jgi:hypothetical protein
VLDLFGMDLGLVPGLVPGLVWDWCLGQCDVIIK